MIEKLLIICTGNICRSPIAEALFSQAFQGSKQTVASAGVAALVGYPADPSAVAVSLANGLDISAHRARQVDRPMLAAADLVVALDGGHQQWITQRFPEFRGKVHKLGRWRDNRDIEDPYLCAIEIFEATYQDIQEDVQSWLYKLGLAKP